MTFVSSGFVANYNGNVWAWNGPYAITRTIRSYCQLEETTITEPILCPNLTIFPKQKAFEFKASESKMFMREEFAEAVFQRTNDAYFVHFMNSQIKNEKLLVNSSSAYVTLSKKACPSVFKESGNYF